MPALSSALRAVRRGGGAVWTPARLPGLLRWYDASLLSSLTLTGTGGNEVSAWADLSSNAKPMIQDGLTATRPLYSVTGLATGYPGLTFDGTAQYLYNTSPGLYAAGACSMFFVLKGNTPAIQTALISEGTSANANPFYVIRSTTPTVTTAVAIIRNDAVTLTANDITVKLLAFDTSVKVFGIVDSGSVFSGRITGGAETTAAYTRAGVLTLNRMALGALLRNAVGSWWKGTVSEVSMYNRALGTDERQLVEAYHSWKWGVASSLPADHPWKARPPS